MRRWTIHMNKHQSAFKELKRCLHRPPILTHSDPDQPYFLYADASKFCFGTKLYQFIHKQDFQDDLKARTFISGKFSDTQCNNAALVREALAIYMSVKWLSFCLQDTECTILCDHKLLGNFVKGKTENNMFNNWPIELSTCKLSIQ